MLIRPNFDIREFVPPEMWNNFGVQSRWFLDEDMLDLAQFYRDFFEAPVYVNTWMNGGQFEERGFRYPDSKTGASLSQHKFGRAFDCTVEGYTPDEVRQAIKENEKLFMDKGLTTIESGEIADTWVHSDIRSTSFNHLFIVTP